MRRDSGLLRHHGQRSSKTSRQPKHDQRLQLRRVSATDRVRQLRRTRQCRRVAFPKDTSKHDLSLVFPAMRPYHLELQVFELPLLQRQHDYPSLRPQEHDDDEQLLAGEHGRICQPFQPAPGIRGK
jgi:hypothetical protein